MSTSSSISFERRDGRVTINEYRVVVTLGGRVAYGPWCFTKRDARTHAGTVRRGLFDEAEAEQRLSAESRARVMRARVQIDHDRRVLCG